jgi:2-methylisocitrate lyase-like PEP mutase family enzyme
VERIAAARAAIDASGADVVLTGRSEGPITGAAELGEAIRRLTAYADAGADCLYAPWLSAPSDIAEVVTAVAPKPVNVLAAGLPVAELSALGVRRVSVGGALARAAWGEFFRAAREIADLGTFTAFARGARGRELNALFSRPANDPN